MSADLERDDKPFILALGCGSAMTVVCLAVAVTLWVLPTATRGRISGDELGLPFSGTGACFLSMAGLLIAGVGLLVLRRGRHHRAPGPTLHGPPPPPRPRHPAGT